MARFAKRTKNGKQSYDAQDRTYRLDPLGLGSRVGVVGFLGDRRSLASVSDDQTPHPDPLGQMVTVGHRVDRRDIDFEAVAGDEIGDDEIGSRRS